MGSIWQPIHLLFFSLCVQPHDQPHARPRGVKKHIALSSSSLGLAPLCHRIPLHRACQGLARGSSAAPTRTAQHRRPGIALPPWLGAGARPMPPWSRAELALRHHGREPKLAPLCAAPACCSSPLLLLIATSRHGSCPATAHLHTSPCCSSAAAARSPPVLGPRSREMHTRCGSNPVRFFGTVGTRI